MIKTSIRLALFFYMLLLFGYQSLSLAQEEEEKRLNILWKIGEEFTYDITTWNMHLGYSTGHFVGLVDHEVVGKAFLFRTKTEINNLSGELNTSIESELFTQGSGYPGYYTAKYTEGGEVRELAGYLAGITFIFHEREDTLENDFEVNVSPETFICDRQSIPHWNLAFYNVPNIDRDTLHFSVLIPYLKKRAKMRMYRQDNAKIEVMGEEVICRVFFSPRTEEYYYITPERRVARVHLPQQGLNYMLVSIEKKPAEEKQDK